MDEILRRLQHATERVAGLERELTRLKAEREHNFAQIANLQEELDKQHEAHLDLEKRYEALKMAKNVRGNADLSIFREQIDAYIKDIDTCLKILGD